VLNILLQQQTELPEKVVDTKRGALSLAVNT
jgi:hypothetical protein